VKIYFYSVIVILSIGGLIGILSEAQFSGGFNGAAYFSLTVPCIVLFISFITTNTKSNYKKIIGTSCIKLFVTFEILFALGKVHYSGWERYKFVMTLKGTLIEHSIFLIILLLIFLTISLPYVYFKKKVAK
jgi:hypothetical protein